MKNCILTNPVGDVLHAIKSSGGTVIDFSGYDVMVQVPEHWVIPDDFSDSDGKYDDEYEKKRWNFIREFAIEEPDKSKVTLRLLIPAPEKKGLMSLVWEWWRNGTPETRLADMRE